MSYISKYLEEIDNKKVPISKELKSFFKSVEIKATPKTTETISSLEKVSCKKVPLWQGAMLEAMLIKAKYYP